MKKYILTAVIMMLLSGCASMRRDIDNERIGNVKPEPKKESPITIEKKIKQLERLNDWFSYPVARSKIQKTGGPIRQAYSRGGIYFELYYDENELKNYYFYDQKLHVDLGWVQNQKTAIWERTEKSKTIREGLLYINPANKVGMYYYPGQDGLFDVFKLRIKIDSDATEEAKPDPAKPGDAKPGDAKSGGAKQEPAKPDPVKPGGAKK